VIFRFHALTVFALVFLTGCANQTTTKAPVADEPDSVAGIDSSASIESRNGLGGPSNLDVRLVDATEFAKEMAAREGKVVLLDMWATW